jgi:hypothetical protein
MTRISATAFALALLVTTAESQAFDRSSSRGWGAPYNSHLDAYSGRPLGPPLTALPPGYQYYNGRLIRVPVYGPGYVYVPHARPRHSLRSKRSVSRRR